MSNKWLIFSWFACLVALIAATFVSADPASPSPNVVHASGRAAADSPGTERGPDIVGSPDIVGGIEAAEDAWPAVASLMYSSISNGYQAHFCGGTLIAPEWILTAAHCVNGKSTGIVDVTLGRHNLTTGSGQRIDAAAIFVHPDFEPSTFNNDIALIRLSTPSNETPVALVTAETITETAAGQLATVAGWGALSQGGTSPQTLHQVSVPIASEAACQAAYSASTVTDGMICAGLATGGKDACQGDSGGPMFVRNSADTAWLQGGIVSWGIGCAQPNAYGVYARISEYTSWIEGHTGPLEGPSESIPTAVVLAGSAAATHSATIILSLAILLTAMTGLLFTNDTAGKPRFLKKIKIP